MSTASVAPPNTRQHDVLSPAHRHELEQGSAISPDIIAERGYRTLRADQLPDIFPDYQRRNCLFIPIRTVWNRPGTFQTKPEQPRISSGKPVKYETLAGTPTCIDVPQRVVPQLNDPGTPLWITEGAKKVDSAISNGIECIVGLQGVYGWRGKNEKGGTTVLPDWEYIALNKRPVVIAFDSDCMTKPQVRDALRRLAAFLQRRGAEVGYCLMPPLPGGEKCGLDDFFASGRGLTDLHEYLSETLPEPETEIDEVVADIVRLADVEAEQLDWLWQGWIPRRMLTILGGYGGDGKSTVMAAITSALTSGATLPDGTTAPRTNVLMLSAEDDISYVVRPRLDVHGADPARVFMLRGTRRKDGSQQWLDLRRDVEIMRATIRMHDIGLVIIDPLSSYLPNADRNSEGDIRDALQPLLRLMEETGVAIVGIMHIGKSGDGRRAAQRLLGSTAFTALARSVIVVADLPDEQQPDDIETGGKQKVLQVVKSNYAIPPAAQSLRRPIDAPIAWTGISPVSIEECFSATTGAKRGPEPMERKDAETLLQELLADGPIKATDVMESMKSLGVSVSSVRRAKAKLGVSSFRRTYDGPWMWKMPLPSQGAQVPLNGQNLNTLDILAYS